MADKKPKFTNITTPPGVAIYPKLNAPDTKFNANGAYSTRVKFSAEEAQPIIDKYETELAKYFEEVKAELMQGDGKSKAKAKSLKLAPDKPYKADFDDEGNETGDLVLNFKMPAKVVREGKPDLIMKPDIFDAAGKKLLNPPEIWGGSKLIIAAQFRPFNTAIGVGLSLRLNAVQIVELSTRGSRDSESYGFGAQEGGYEASDEATSAPAAAEPGTTTADDDGSGDF